MILFPKFKGDFETDMRIRLRNGNHTIISETFRGYLNPKQFYFSNDDDFSEFLRLSLSNPLDTNRAEYIDGYLFGAHHILPTNFKYKRSQTQIIE